MSAFGPDGQVFLATLLAERDCARLMTRYATFADARDPRLADLFVADGELVTPLSRAHGMDAIRAQITGTPATRLTRHMCSNLTVELLDETHATGGCDILLVAEHLDRQSGKRGFRIVGLGAYADEYRREGGRWMIARRTFIAAA